MKGGKIFKLCAVAALLGTMPSVKAARNVQAQQAEKTDSVYLFSYVTTTDEGRSGLRFAWSRDAEQWFSVDHGGSFLKCDYGAWGAEKRMVSPRLFRDGNGQWHCVWQLNGTNREFAHAASDNLTAWGRQSYFTADDYDRFVAKSWQAGTEKEALVEGVRYTGTMRRAAWPEVDYLNTFAGNRAYRARLHDEQMKDDAIRFAGLQSPSLQITVRPEKQKPISDKLIGVFFEDINYGADGGLYAELIRNRDFEFSSADHNGWTPTKAWSVQGEGKLTVKTENPLHKNNPHYVVWETKSAGVSLVNEGYDGIALKKGEKYSLSFYARTGDQGKKVSLKLALVSPNGVELSTEQVSVGSRNWKQYRVQLRPAADAEKAKLVLTMMGIGSIQMDMVSLFPENTFRGRKNGLRADLAQAIADLHPRFMRFPGGCVSHGNGLGNIYRWKNTIGPLEARKPMRNLWGYHQTMGLGFFEYFQFCEDMGAEPLPVLAAGVPCQNSATIPGKLLSGGQQGGIPMDEMDEYIQDIFDLIEYANGDPKTNKWAKMRAEAGHPKPFGLKFLGIGNEDLITDVFEERFTQIYRAVKEKYPAIEIVGTVGPFYEGTDYVEGWKLAEKLGVDIVDEHYYNTPGWFIYNQDFYDRYPRDRKTKVYLGEYAAHLPGRPNCVETALSEALYLTAVERNADVVRMTSYAPLLAKEKRTQWNPDLIYFNNTEVKPTVGYYVQQLFGKHAGDAYIPADVQVSNDKTEVKVRIGQSVVRDSSTGDVIVKLVNLLPVSAKSRIDLRGIVAENFSQDALLTVLKGAPTDKQAKPSECAIHVNSEFDYELPPYSLSIIHLTGNHH